jgi:hypothetical protein
MAGQYSSDRIGELLRQACPPAVAPPDFKAGLRQCFIEQAAAIITTVPKQFWKRSLAWGSTAVAMAIAIESILGAEIRSRFDNYGDIQTLSERLRRILENRPAEQLASTALLRELEDVIRELADILRETHRPILESITEEVIKRVQNVTQTDALAAAGAIVTETSEMCLDDWEVLRGYMDRELERCLTLLLSSEFEGLQLHVGGQDFVDQCIRLLKEDLLVSLAPAVSCD